MPAAKKVARKAASKAASKAAKKVAKTAGRKPARKGASKKGTSPKFGRPGTAGKAEGRAAVQAWIQHVRPEHRPIVHRLDELITSTIPGLRFAVKWSSPMYGLPDKGWIISMGSFKGHVGLNFFGGPAMKPPPPEGESKGMRRVNIRHMAAVDDPKVRSWIEQAEHLPGWGKVD